MNYYTVMAICNQWMNQKLYAVCADISDLDRKSDRGAFFKSIDGTLDRILVGDLIWLGRFTQQPFVAKLDGELYINFSELRAERERLDAIIIDWAKDLTPSWLDGQMVDTSPNGDATRTTTYRQRRGYANSTSGELMTSLTGKIEENGFSTIDRYFDLDSIDLLIQDIIALNLTPGRAGIRNLLELAPSVSKLAQSQEIRSLVEPILGDTMQVVRGIFFDNQPNTNWKVPWHQDRTIAVKNRLDVPDYHPWSLKAGIPHVQPPTAILDQMLTVRIHLDKTNESNGALKVIPGSHRQGKLTDSEIDRWKQTSPGISCNCEAGGVLLMRPLLLHASSLAIDPHHRRVIHLEYASSQLPSGLEWR